MVRAAKPRERRAIAVEWLPMIAWLSKSHAFPPLTKALQDPNGLLAAGGDLSPERLLAAYSRGIFPWYSPGQPILWWSPDPRMVLFPAEFAPRRSLAKVLRNREYEVRCDTAFEQVMRHCAGTPREGQDGTWITEEILAGYCGLHARGHAHSIETWVDGKLVGGLYGVALGRAFYGESMFSHATDASKIAFCHLVRFLQTQACGIIDCQMRTDHLASLGAREIPRAEFAAHLTELTPQPAMSGWSSISRSWFPAEFPAKFPGGTAHHATEDA
jgi:leucyl/phenylalanyl-tRNA--protein transferase